MNLTVTCPHCKARYVVDTEVDCDVPPTPQPNDTERRIIGDAAQVLEFLNQTTGKYFPPQPACLDPIKHQLRSGATVEDCKLAVRQCNAEWKDGEKSQSWIRPSTIFGLKFAEYVANGRAKFAKRNATLAPESDAAWFRKEYGEPLDRMNTDRVLELAEHITKNMQDAPDHSLVPMWRRMLAILSREFARREATHTHLDAVGSTSCRATVETHRHD